MEKAYPRSGIEPRFQINKQLVNLQSVDGDEEEATEDEEQQWKERAQLEEAARDVLLQQIIGLRSECAHLRAQIEKQQKGQGLRQMKH